LKKTILLDDEPATEDQFGSHEAIADQLSNIIATEPKSHSIAILGSWGSGKSTILNLMMASLRRRFKENLEVFVYDAWAHQGDPLRRSFLDDLIASVGLDGAQKEELTRQVWNTDEEVKTTTESALRPHAKVLAGLLALFPLAWTFLEVPGPGESLGLLFCYPRNWVAISLFAPLPLYLAFCASVRRFGSDKLSATILGANDEHQAGGGGKRARPRIFSLLLHQVTGHVERKQTRSPADSVAEFRRVFKKTLATARANRPHIKLVIVIDNIDRLTPVQARDFWSTMQTFFGEAGGLRERWDEPNVGLDRGYWLVAPFAPTALAEHDDLKVTQAFIDKAFWLSVNVPSPITDGWRNYLWVLLASAFPEHDDLDRGDVREIYDLSVAEGGVAPSPRTIKLFVNSIVGTYRVHRGNISPAAVGAYLLAQGKMQISSIPDDAISLAQRRICGPKWRTVFAALHFGVPEEQAAQLMLRDPIRRALSSGHAGNLNKLSDKRGFPDALARFINVDLLEGAKDDLARVMPAAAAMSGLVETPDPIIASVWRSLRNIAASSASWEGANVFFARGLALLLKTADIEMRANIASAAVRGLGDVSVSFVSDEMDVEYNSEIVDAYSDMVKILSQEVSVDAITVPAHDNLLVGTLVNLRNSDVHVLGKVIIGSGLSSITAALSRKISEGQAPDSFQNFMKLCRAKKVEVDWPEILTKIQARLGETELDDQEIENLVCAATDIVWNYPTLPSEIKAVSIHVQLLAVLNSDVTNVTLCNALASLILLDRPYRENPRYMALLSSQDPEIIGIMTGIGVRHSRRTKYLHRALAYPSSSLVNSIVLKLSRDRERFAFDAEDIEQNIDELRVLSSEVPTEAILGNLAKTSEVLDRLSARGFQLSLSLAYSAFVTAKVVDEGFLTWLQNGLQVQPSSIWQSVLTNDSAQHMELLELSLALRRVTKAFELRTSVADAVETHLRTIASGEIAYTQNDSQRLFAVLELIPHRRSSLLKRNFTWLLERDSETVLRQLGYLSVAVPMPRGFSAEKLLRSLALPVVDSGGHDLLPWIIQGIQSDAFDLGKLSSESREDLVAHVDQAILIAGSEALLLLRNLVVAED